MTTPITPPGPGPHDGVVLEARDPSSPTPTASTGTPDVQTVPPAPAPHETPAHSGTPDVSSPTRDQASASDTGSTDETREASSGRGADTPESSPRLTHVRADGTAHMVDVTAKAVTAREASAAGRVLVSEVAVEALRGGTIPKGDALAVARIAGIQAAKRTPDLVPLAHPIAVHAVSVDLVVADHGVDITATVRTADRTGIEMEALTCVSVAALALVDMIKAVDRHARITDIRVTAKSGGRSGDWRES